jgi:hypothetical protein
MWLLILTDLWDQHMGISEPNFWIISVNQIWVKYLRAKHHRTRFYVIETGSTWIYIYILSKSKSHVELVSWWYLDVMYGWWCARWRTLVRWVARWGRTLVRWVARWGRTLVRWVARWGRTLVRWVARWGRTLVRWVTRYEDVRLCDGLRDEDICLCDVAYFFQWWLVTVEHESTNDNDIIEWHFWNLEHHNSLVEDVDSVDDVDDVCLFVYGDTSNQFESQ